MPEEDELPDFYEILGVSPDADIDKIRKAYLNLAKQHHSDTGATDDERMKQINEAWEWLRTAQRKKMYDAYLEMKARGSLEEEVEKLVRQKKQEAEEEIRRQKKEAQDQIDEAMRRLAGEAKKQSGTAQEQQSTPRQNFSSDFPPPPTGGTSQKRTGSITWKSPPSPARPPSFFRRKNIIILIVLAVVMAGGIGGIRLLSNKMQIVSFTVDQNKVVVGTNVLFTITISAPFSVLPFWESGREVGLFWNSDDFGPTDTYRPYYDDIQNWHWDHPCESNGGITCTVTYSNSVPGTLQFQAYIHDQYHDAPIGPIYTLSVTWLPSA
jgi:hypothetical protein